MHRYEIFSFEWHLPIGSISLKINLRIKQIFNVFYFSSLYKEIFSNILMSTNQIFLDNHHFDLQKKQPNDIQLKAFL